MSFCTNCGTQLLEGQACECTEVKQFCTDCGAKIYGGLPCACNEEPVQDPGDDHFADEFTVRQYNIAVLCNWLRAAGANGDLQVTNKRVIFKAEGIGAKARTTAYRELALSEIVGVDAVISRRFSIPHFVIGLLTIAAAAVLIAAVVFMGGWAVTTLFVSRPPVHEFLRQSYEQFAESRVVDTSRLSLILGLVAGFGGAVLYFVLRRKYWLQVIMLGASVGAFLVVGMTGNAFAYVLLGASVILNMYGLVMFARLPDLAVSFYGRGGAYVDILRTKGRGRVGYAESAPTAEAEAAICELGEVIAGIQNRMQ